MKRNVQWFARLLCLAAISVRADQIVMQNGDVYNGRLISLNTNSLVLQSDVLGKITLSPSKVTTINLSSTATTNTSTMTSASGVKLPRVSAVTQSGPPTDPSTALSQLTSQTNLIQQVQSQFLAGASPEANQKFNELLDGVASGKISIGDSRAQAQSAADQLRSMKKDLGPEESEAVDSYLGILNDFLSETGDSSGATNSGATLSTSQPSAAGSLDQK